MNLPVLSICIPTYNRARELEFCITSIANQISGDLAGLVEITISDNGSTDNTKTVAEALALRYPYIRYFRNAENVGFDKNVLNVVEKASGEYCWLLGDDDALFEDALASVLPILQSGKYEYVLANAWGYDRAMQKPAVSFPNLRLSSDMPFAALADFVRGIKNYKDLVGYFGGMSCQIFKRKTWLALPGKEKFIGTQTVHLFVLLQAYKNLPALVACKPLVITRAVNMRWDTFSGLETVKRRAFSTRSTQVWISKLYSKPYSAVALALKCYGGTAYGT